jgi:hypothetical protein
MKNILVILSLLVSTVVMANTTDSTDSIVNKHLYRAGQLGKVQTTVTLATTGMTSFLIREEQYDTARKFSILGLVVVTILEYKKYSELQKASKVKH